MNDTEIIFLVLSGIYLWECVCSTPAGAVCFSSAFSRLKSMGAVAVRGADQGRLSMTSLLPTATTFLCHTWPVPLDAEGFLLPADACHDDERQLPEARWMTFDAAARAKSQERELVVDDLVLAKFGSPLAARMAAQRMQALGAASPGERAAAVQAFLEEQFDTDRIAAQRTLLRQATMSLRACCGVMGATGFLAAPFMYLQNGSLIHRGGLELLCFFAVVWLAVVVQYFFARRKVVPEGFWARLGHTLLLCVSPASAMRSAESVGRDLLTLCDPLAVASQVCSADDFRQMAGERLRGLKHPRPGDRLDESTQAGQALAWFHGESLRRLEALVKASGCDPAEFEAEPPRGIDAQSYCQRCLMQYVFYPGDCPECGLPVRAFVMVPGATAS